ncbi:MAG TPA: TlpA disulfide reductase family protein [Pirellulales bacterium]|nr:TlpA disulfide reductase family protein [Pirellulales bacterium]
MLISTALACAVAGADAPLAPGTQLSYRGSIEAHQQEPGKPHKTFDLTLWVVQKSDAGAEIVWLVEERGRGEFPWSERFGRLGLDAHWRTAAEGPAVVYDRGDGRSTVPVPLPFLEGDKPLAAGEMFHEGKLEYRVEKAAKTADQPTWQVLARDPFGPKRVLWVQHSGPLVIALNDKVTLGRGEEYQLKLELLSSEQLDAAQLTALTKASDALLGLRGKLNLPARSQEVEWKGEQLAVLQQQLPKAAQTAAGTPLEQLVQTAQRDFELQSGRTTAVTELGTKFAGRDVADFSIRGLAGEQLTQADLAGHVTVLHFWDYRDEPLKEPYGQVGYLDFLYHRRKDSGLQLYGVAVDGRLAEEKSRGAAERSVRKLRSFMNLSYPVLLDTGGLVKQFGDPRLLGANLPLFVVIGPDAKILHYHVGHYDVHQDQGLKELDEVVAKALEAQTSANDKP